VHRARETSIWEEKRGRGGKGVMGPFLSSGPQKKKEEFSFQVATSDQGERESATGHYSASEGGKKEGSQSPAESFHLSRSTRKEGEVMQMTKSTSRQSRGGGGKGETPTSSAPRPLRRREKKPSSLLRPSSTSCLGLALRKKGALPKRPGRSPEKGGGERKSSD